MPKVANYRAKSVIYFEGDRSEKIFILQSGRVSLNTRDLETGEPVRTSVQMGEFFGISSALGKYPRTEDAMVLSESSVITLTVSEFEQLAASNPRISTKILKLFSTQLRIIHEKVRSLLKEEDQVDPGKGLFHCGEYYMAHERYYFAHHAFSKYLKLFPGGNYRETVEEYLRQVQSLLGSEQFEGFSENTGSRTEDLSEHLQDEMETGKSLYEEKDYTAAGKVFRRVVDSAESGTEVHQEATLFYGRCLYQSGQFDEMIELLSDFARSNSAYERIYEMLFYIGAGYKSLNNTAKAKAFLERAHQLAPAKDPIQKQAQVLLKELGG